MLREIGAGTNAPGLTLAVEQARAAVNEVMTLTATTASEPAGQLIIKPVVMQAISGSSMRTNDFAALSLRPAYMREHVDFKHSTNRFMAVFNNSPPYILRRIPFIKEIAESRPARASPLYTSEIGIRTALHPQIL